MTRIDPVWATVAEVSHAFTARLLARKTQSRMLRKALGATLVKNSRSTSLLR
jgi:hypothetical protein